MSVLFTANWLYWSLEQQFSGLLWATKGAKVEQEQSVCRVCNCVFHPLFCRELFFDCLVCTATLSSWWSDTTVNTANYTAQTGNWTRGNRKLHTLSSTTSTLTSCTASRPRKSSLCKTKQWLFSRSYPFNRSKTHHHFWPGAVIAPSAPICQKMKLLYAQHLFLSYQR